MKSIPRFLSVLTIASLGSVLVNRPFFNHLLSLMHGSIAEFPNKNTTTTSTTTTTRTAPQLNWRKSPGMIFIHVGKAGGMTVTRSTRIGCMGSQPRFKPWTLQQIQLCMQRNFPTELVLPYRVTKFMHMFSFNHTELQDPDYSFLYVLRNPVDRYISAYKYGHPSNCNTTKTKGQGNEFRCPNQKLMERNTPNFPVVRFYRCFPTLEDLAQYGVSLPPASTDDDNDHSTSNATIKLTGKTRKCTPLARQCATGIRHKGTCGGEPHKSMYNYQFYANHTVDQYPDKHVLAIRTEHEWDDLVNLDQQLGGTGKFKKAGLHVSHGSETYQAAQLSEQGYHKLCCVLLNEMDIYRSLLLRAVNLNETAKRETLQSLYEKCNIKPSWSEWKVACQKRLDHDEELLKKKQK